MDIIFVDDVIVYQTHPPFQYSHTNTNDLENKTINCKTTSKKKQ